MPKNFQTMKKCVKSRQRAKKMAKMKSVVFFAIFWCKNIIEIPKFFYPKLKSTWDDENGGVTSVKKSLKIHFSTEKSEIALTNAEMSALSIETISNPHMAAVGPLGSKMLPPCQVFICPFHLVCDFEKMCSFARWR